MQAAAANVGVNSVAGGWAYQGSRASSSQGRILNAQGNALNGVRAADGQVLWRAEAQGRGLASGAQAFSPPALGGPNLYLCSEQGHLLSVRQADGALRFCYATQVPMAYQPALAQGNMYIGTSNGLLICLRTGGGCGCGEHGPRIE